MDDRWTMWLSAFGIRTPHKKTISLVRICGGDAFLSSLDIFRNSAVLGRGSATQRPANLQFAPANLLHERE
jgi:hypothetical protein